MAHLIVKTPKGGPVIHELTGTGVTIGRLSDNAIVLEDPTVSRDHAEIIDQQKSFHLHDLNSFNGTMVNGQPVREIDLKDGDVVRFAGVECSFRVTPAVKSAGPELFPPPAETADAQTPIFRRPPAPGEAGTPSRPLERAPDAPVAPSPLNPVPSPPKNEITEVEPAPSRNLMWALAIGLVATLLLGAGAGYIYRAVFAAPTPAPALTQAANGGGGMSDEARARADSERTYKEQIKSLQAKIDSFGAEAARVKDLQSQIDSLKTGAARVKELQDQIDSLKTEATNVKGLQDQITQLHSQLADARKPAAPVNLRVQPPPQPAVAETQTVETITEKQIEALPRDLVGRRLRLECTFRRVDNSAVETLLGNDPDYVGLSAHDMNGDLVQYVFAPKAKYGSDLQRLKYGDKITLTGSVRYVGGQAGAFAFFADEISL